MVVQCLQSQHVRGWSRRIALDLKIARAMLTSYLKKIKTKIKKRKQIKKPPRLRTHLGLLCHVSFMR